MHNNEQLHWRTAVTSAYSEDGAWATADGRQIAFFTLPKCGFIHEIRVNVSSGNPLVVAYALPPKKFVDLVDADMPFFSLLRTNTRDAGDDITISTTRTPFSTWGRESSLDAFGISLHKEGTLGSPADRVTTVVAVMLEAAVATPTRVAVLYEDASGD